MIIGTSLTGVFQKGESLFLAWREVRSCDLPYFDSRKDFQISVSLLSSNLQVIFMSEADSPPLCFSTRGLQIFLGREK